MLCHHVCVVIMSKLIQYLQFLNTLLLPSSSLCCCCRHRGLVGRGDVPFHQTIVWGAVQSTATHHSSVCLLSVCLSVCLAVDCCSHPKPTFTDQHTYLHIYSVSECPSEFLRGDRISNNLRTCAIFLEIYCTVHPIPPLRIAIDGMETEQSCCDLITIWGLFHSEVFD